MPEIVGDLDQITSGTNCSDKPGIRVLYWTEYDNIDLAAMAADPTKFDPANNLILGYTMVGAATFNKVEFERKQAYYDFTYTKEAGSVALLIATLFKGKNNDRKNKLDKAARSCAIVAHIYDENGTQRVVGMDWNGVIFSRIVDYLAPGRILDSSGQRGSSRSRDEMDLTGECDFLPLFGTVVETAIPV